MTGYNTNKKQPSYEMLFDIDSFYVYPFYFADISLTSSVKKAMGGSLSRILAEFNKDHAGYYYNIAEVNALGKRIFNKILKDKNYFRIVEKKVLGYGEELLQFCDKVSKIKISESTNKELYNIYHRYAKLIIKMRDWGWVPVVLDGIKKAYLSDYLLERLKKILKRKGLKNKEISEYYSILTSSERKSEVMQEAITRLNLTLQIIKKLPDFRNLFREKDDKKLALHIKNKYPLIYRLLKKHTQEFGWLTFYYIGPPMSVPDLLKAIRNDIFAKQSIDNKIKKIEKHFRELPKRKQTIIKKLNLPPDIVYLLNVSSFFIYLKDHRKGIYQKSYVAMEPIIKEIAKRLNLTVKELKYLVDKEIKEALLRRKDFKDITKKRVEYCVSHIFRGEIKVLTGDKATQLINKYILKKPLVDFGESNKIKGLVAYSGKVRGIVKIIINKEDVDKLKDGDVLVSPATNPDLIIAMQRASAFVTDRGGITSHAAIVSRELKKPCIVGTGNATKVLKDGDLVEVDAENGIVIKLTSNR